MKVVIERKKNFDHIVGQEFKDVYGEYEEALAKTRIGEIVDEYEAHLGINGFELTDQDKMNDIEAVTYLHEGTYDFDCGDFTYYIEILGE